jgi:biotin-(acetyl-CoA carboxylase) ligase
LVWNHCTFVSTLDVPIFQSLLKTKSLGCNVVHLNETDSTQIIGKAHAADHKDCHGTIIITDLQKAGARLCRDVSLSLLGQGRRGRGWTSEPGLNLLFSFIWTAEGSSRPVSDVIAEMMKLNFSISVATVSACRLAGSREILCI